jgi:hypothetical protein
MSRPIGVTLIAVALFGFSLWTLHHAALHAGGHRARSFLIASVIMTLAGLLAAEALWSLRSHAFLAFMVWAACATVAVVLERLGAPRPVHATLLIRDVACMGIAIGIVALYLRRAV